MPQFKPLVMDQRSQLGTTTIEGGRRGERPVPSCNKRENDLIVAGRQAACADRLKRIAGGDDKPAHARLPARAERNIIRPMEAREFCLARH